jgi:hypothetical protein
MADTKDTTRDAANPEGTQPTDRTAAPSAEQLAAALNPAAGAPPTEPIPDLDETVPGGAYQTQSGDWVNAEGQPIKAPKGKG